MRYKKFLLIPALLFFYLFFVVDFMVSFSPATVTSAEAGQSGGGVQTIGVGEAISATVTRPYFFGLIMLPVYTSGFGNIGGYHEAFFWFLGLLTAAFVFIEWRSSVMPKSTYARLGKLEYQMGYKRGYNLEGTKMAKTTFGGIDAMAILKAIGVGIAFGIVAWFVSTILGDTGATTALALLVMYLSYKFRQ